MSDDNRKSGGGKGRPPRGPGSGRDRNGPSRAGSRPEGRGFKGKRPEGRSFSDRRSEGRSDRPSSGETMIKGAFRPRKPRDEGARAGSRPSGEGRSFSENRSQEGSKRRFSPSKGPRRSFSEGAGGERPSRPPRERREGDRPQGDRPFRVRPSGDRPSGDRPFRERREGDRPQGDRPFRARPSGDRPFRERGEGDRPRSPRPPRDGSFRDQGKPRGRPQGGRGNRDFSAPKARPGDRIAKVMARAGLCSRRDAEAWILEGRVIVNGETLLTPARDIVPSDRVEVDGKPLPLRERTRLFLYHKSRGLVTTARDPEGRPTVFAQLPKGLPRLISVGRLDINTEGLL
ncbi:MAG: S4 domain-containing protein, partial [Alphaproteobacteria bacterium]